MPRHPDIELPEPIPAGLVLIEGKHLMIIARARGIAYGVARERIPCCGSTRLMTIGIIVAASDRQRMLDAIEARNEEKNRKRPLAKPISNNPKIDRIMPTPETPPDLKQENADLRRMNELLKKQLTKALEIISEERKPEIKAITQ